MVFWNINFLPPLEFLNVSQFGVLEKSNYSSYKFQYKHVFSFLVPFFVVKQADEKHRRISQTVYFRTINRDNRQGNVNDGIQSLFDDFFKPEFEEHFFMLEHRVHHQNQGSIQIFFVTFENGSMNFDAQHEDL